jgi:hypothetical protein
MKILATFAFAFLFALSVFAHPQKRLARFDHSGRLIPPKVGDVLSTDLPQPLDELVVERLVTDGHKGFVAAVKGTDDVLYALKLPLENSESIAKSFKKEIGRTQELLNLGYPVATVLVLTSDFMIKPWIEGQRGDVWIQNWTAAGASRRVVAYKKLVALFAQLIQSGKYVHNLKDLNLILESRSRSWIIVDSGAPEAMARSELLDVYVEVFRKRWLRDYDTNGEILKHFKSDLQKALCEVALK